MMIALLRTLKVEMNGAVVEAMEARGLRYALSYGVSLPTIKSISSAYAPNHSLAQLLYRQDVRELRIAALYIAQPQMMTCDQADFWAQGVITSEIAEILAMTMLSKSPQAEAITSIWINSENELLNYAALMSAARCATTEWNREKLNTSINRFAQSGNILLRRGAELLTDRVAMLSETIS